MAKHLLRNDTTLTEYVFNLIDRYNIVGGLRVPVNIILTLLTLIFSRPPLYAQHESENDHEPIGPGS